MLLLLGGGVLIGALLALLGAGGSILLLPLLVTGLALPLRARGRAAVAAGGAAAGPGQSDPGLAAAAGGLAAGPVAGHSRSGRELGGCGLGAQRCDRPFHAADVVCLGGPGRGLVDAAPARQGEGRIQLLVQGLGVGLLTGIAGVGGGFAIVPALVLLARLPMTQASGTSLLVICASSLMALVRHGHWPAASLPLLLPLLLGGGIGILLGQRWVSRVSERRLRQGFAALLLVSAIRTGLEALQPQRPSTEAGLRISTRWPEA